LALSARIKASFASRSTKAVMWFVSQNAVETGGTVVRRTSGSGTSSSGTVSGGSTGSSTGSSETESDLPNFNFVGALVSNFGTQGKAEDTLEGADASCVFMDSASRPIVVSRHFGDIVITRFTTSGQLDSSFNGGSPRIVHNVYSGGSLQEYVHCVPTADGGIFSVTSTDSGSNQSPAYLTKILPNGQIDMSYGDYGNQLITLNIIDPTIIQSVSRDAQGDLYIVFQRYGYEQDIYVSKLGPSGQLVTDWGSNGTLTITSPQNYTFSIRGSTIDSDGRLLLAGSIYTLSGGQVMIARATKTGVVDSTFGSTFGSYQTGVYSENFNPSNLSDVGGTNSAGDLIELSDGSIAFASNIKTSNLGNGIHSLAIIKLSSAGQRIGEPIYHSTAKGRLFAESMHALKDGFVISLSGDGSLGSNHIVGIGLDFSERFDLDFSYAGFGNLRGGLAFDGSGNGFVPFRWNSGGTNNGYAYLVKFN
jgi:hypothetical protein